MTFSHIFGINEFASFKRNTSSTVYPLDDCYQEKQIASVGEDVEKLCTVVRI